MIMKKVIITGANGFVGKNLVKHLAAKDVKVYAIVKDITSDISEIKNITNVEIVYCNLTHILKLNEKIKDTDIDVFYHFAWAGTSGTLRTDYELQLSNVKGCCDAVKTAYNMNVKKFVFAGSILEYECQKYLSLDFSKPGLGNIYNTAKITSHYMAKTLAYNLGIDFISATISNIYGVGEISQRLICTTIVKLLKKQKTLFTEGNQLYDFIYIDDAVKAFELIGDYGKAFKNYYIGNKNPQLLKEFLIKIRDCIDSTVDIGLGELPYNGAFLNYEEFSTLGLYEDFDFKPDVNFENGIKQTTEWLMTQL
jgi:nucleoside-diphosphate-sugar epimerase